MCPGPDRKVLWWWWGRGGGGGGGGFLLKAVTEAVLSSERAVSGETKRKRTLFGIHQEHEINYRHYWHMEAIDYE